MVQLQWMRWQVSLMWWHEYSGCDVIEWCDIIKSGSDVICSSIWCHTYCGCVIIHKMGVLWLIILVWWQRYSGCAVRYIRPEGRYNSFHIMRRVLWCHKSWVRCHIQCLLCHIYSTWDVINRVCVISSIQWVWSPRHRHEKCDVIYRGFIVLTQCVSCQI